MKEKLNIFVLGLNIGIIVGAAMFYGYLVHQKHQAEIATRDFFRQFDVDPGIAIPPAPLNNGAAK